jgi:hypothetical protein
MIADRLLRRARFEKIVARKLERGLWSRDEVGSKWLKNLSRMYSKRGWRVQHGATGRQQKMPKHSPNPWAAYRDFERQVGGTSTKGYVSPWEIKQIKAGKTLLDKGLIYIQRQERKGGTTTGVPKEMIQQWIDEKNRAILKARGERRRELIEQRERLRRSL